MRSVSILSMRRGALLAAACYALAQLRIATVTRSSSPSREGEGPPSPLVRRHRRLAAKEKSSSSSSGRLHPWVDPPAPLLSGTGRAWNATNLRWLGRSYYFEDEPTYRQYTPHQIQKAFRRHSVLMIGDSTVRRFYGTLHGILTRDIATGKSSHDKLPTMFYQKVAAEPPLASAEYRANLVNDAVRSGDADARLDASAMLHAPVPISDAYLNHAFVVDVNKRSIAEPCSKLPPSCVVAADGTNVTARMTYRVCRSRPTGGWEAPSEDVPARPLAYDHVGGACVPEFLDYLNVDFLCDHAGTKNYTLLLMSAGVWETASRKACKHAWGEYYGTKWPEGLYHVVEQVLTKLTLLQSPRLAVVWRTSAFYEGDRSSDVILQMNRRAMAFIDNFNAALPPGKTSNLTYMDWGTTMITKSQGPDRLSGDMKAHYALEARILQAQMLTNILYERNLV